MILHLITDRRRLSTGAAWADVLACLLRQARFAIEGGVDVIQTRESDLEARELVALTRALVREARGSHTRVVVNDRLDVALAANADGVHLPARAIPVAAARRLAPRRFLVGRSVHDAAEADAARDADYLIAGTVWPTASKPSDHRLLGVAGLASIVRSVGIPVLAVGGVTLERSGEVASSGAAGIAAIGLFMGPPVEEGCRAIALSPLAAALRQRFDTSGSGS